MLSIGYGIHQAWIYSAMFGSSYIFPSDSMIYLPLNFSAIEIPAVSLVFLISILLFSLTLLFISFTDQKFLRFYVSKQVLVGAAVLTSLGTFAVFATNGNGSLEQAALLFSGIATGIGSALLLVYWGTAYSRNNTATITINTAVAVVIAIALYSAILHWVPHPISGIIVGLLPLVEVFFLWQLTPIPYSKRHAVPIFNALMVRRGPFVLRFGVPVLVFGFALGALRAVSIQEMLPASDITSQLIVWLAAGIATVLTIATIFFSSARKANGPEVGPSDMLFRALLPIIAIAIFILPFAGLDGSLVFNLIVLVGYMCFEALMWIFFGDLSQRFRLSPIMVFGLGRGFLAFGSLAGSVFMVYDPLGLFPSALFGEAGASLIILLAMVLAYVFLPRYREIKAIVTPYSAEATIGNAVAQLNAIVNEDTPDTAKVPQTENAFKGGRFRAQCEAISDEFLLSRRESEVLFLLAKGHNAAFIQEKLCISRSTAKTHISHIYRKLDIHTQQELLGMLDAARNSDEPADKY